jgi:hypothetical protein
MTMPDRNGAPPPAIGGYFPLATGTSTHEYHAGLRRYQSARAAWRALVAHLQPTRVWMPAYLCRDMADSLAGLLVRVERYRLDEALMPLDIDLAREDLLLYPNYFGVSGAKVDALLERYPGQRVVVDNAQAFFATPRVAIATLYSPRKFVGVPDGAYLATALDLPLPTTIDNGSLDRCHHLLARAAGDVEGGYVHFLRAEASLAEHEPRQMSWVTRHLLSSIDYDAVRHRRADNFRYLHTLLGGINRFPMDLAHDDVPLCYPLLCVDASRRAGLLDALRAQRIYMPIYWPDVMNGAEPWNLASRLLAVPLDQRYGRAELDRLLGALFESGLEPIRAATLPLA